MENISKLVYMAVEKCGEWEREYSTKMFGALYQQVQKYFDYIHQQERGGEKGGYRAREEVLPMNIENYSE